MGGAGRPGPATSAKWQRWERPGSRVTFFWLGMLDSLKDRSALCRILGFYLWISQPAGERQIPNSLSRIGKQTEHWRPTLGTSCFHAGRVSHVVSSSELILNCCLLGGFEEEGFDDLEDPAKIGRLYCRISTRFMNVLVNTMVGNELEGRSAAPGLYHQVPSLAACMPIPLSNQSVSSSLTPPALLARTLGIPNVVATSCSSEAVQQESFPGQENPSFPPPAGPEPIPLGGNSANALVVLELQENVPDPSLIRSYAAGGAPPSAVLGRFPPGLYTW